MLRSLKGKPHRRGRRSATGKTGGIDGHGRIRLRFRRSAMLALVVLALLPSLAKGQSSPRSSSSLQELFDLDAPIPGTDEYYVKQRADRIAGALADLDAVDDAYVDIVDPQGESSRVSIQIRLQLAEDATWSSQLSSVLLSIVHQFEPTVDDDGLFVVDTAGQVLLEDSVAVPSAVPAASPSTSGSAPGIPMPIIVGVLLGIIVVAVGAWWLTHAHREASPAESAAADPWEFVGQADAQALRNAFGRQRPELLGAVLAAAGERTSARIRRKLGPATPMPQPPPRPMHPAVAETVRALLQGALVEARRNE